jgi:hypothetical protein
MKHFYSILLLVAMFPLSALANNGTLKGKYTKEKKIHKEYTVNSGAGLMIDNSYGSVSIVTWDQNKTVIDVIIKANGNDEDKVTEKLNEITIDFTANASEVTASTQFGSKKGNWSSWWGKGKNNVSVEVNYVVKIPRTNSVNLSNDYGIISIDTLQGQATVHCDYGQLIIGELLAENNSLHFDYTKNSTIQFMKSGKINADYSEFMLEKADRLQLNADYTKSEIGEVQDVNYNNDYGKINIRKVALLQGRGDYIHHNIGSVSGGLNINTDYGSVTVDEILGSSKDIIIKADYTKINLGLSQGVSFNFELNLNYTTMSGDESFQFMNKTVDGSSKYYLGYYGKKDSNTTININADYGGITFN